MLKFTKMHGLGNDYIIIDAINQTVENLSELAKLMCDRHIRVGSDGIILIKKSKSADFYMQVINPDGSEAEMCGNGIRMLAKYVFERGLTNKKNIVTESMKGLHDQMLFVEGPHVKSVRTDMGPPILEPDSIPMNVNGDRVVDIPIEVNGETYNVTAVSMGNPHCVLFVDNVDAAPVTTLGPKIERHELFPNRTNVQFVQFLDSRNIRMRVWERGVGETLACGSGTCAAVVACILNGKTDDIVSVHLALGSLLIEWNEGGSVFMTGSAMSVFDGVWNT